MHAALISGEYGNSPGEDDAVLRGESAARIYPQATAGTLESFGYDPDHRSFTMTATAEASGAPTVIFVPAGMSGTVTVHGAARPGQLVAEPDGSHRVLVYPTGRGAYSIAVS